MENQGAFFPLVVATLVAGCVMSLLYEQTHEHWVPILLAIGVVGGLVCTAGRLIGR